MGMPFPKLPAHLFEPSLQPFIERLNQWGRDTDRFQQALQTPADTPAPMPTLALMPESVLDPTRILGGVSAFAPGGITGHLLPSSHATFDLGRSATPLRWRDLFLSRNADIDGTLDVLGGATVTGHARFASGISSAGMSLSGQFIATSPNALHEIRGQVKGYSQFFVLSDGSNTDIAANLGVIFGTYGLTSLGPTDFGSHVHAFSTHAVDGALGVTGQATFSSGLTASGSTFTGMLSAVAGVSISGATVTIYPGGTNNVVVGASALRPAANAISSLGTAARRWATVFGSTGNLSSLICGSTFTCTGVAQLNGNVTIPLGTTLSIDEGAGIALNGPIVIGSAGGPHDWGCNVDDTYVLGDDEFRWKNVIASRTIHAGLGATISSGTTVALNGLGNYFYLSGTSTIYGLSTADTFYTSNPKYFAGSHFVIGLSSTAKFSHSSRIQLIGGITFSGQTNDHSMFVCHGNENWKEVFRQRNSGQLFQPTGPNKPSEWVTLAAGGSVTVNNQLVGTSTGILLTGQRDGGTPGWLRVSERTAGASFHVISSSGTDTSEFFYMLIEPEGL